MGISVLKYTTMHSPCVVLSTTYSLFSPLGRNLIVFSVIGNTFPLKYTFEFPENRGCVYLLTGANGAGKSTLISTLAQIGNPGALDHFFQPNINFRDTENILSISQICYNAGDDLSADFYFSTEQNKWVCKGDSAAVFAAFGFAETLFAGAKPKRKPVPGELFETGDVRPADPEICKAAAEIFDDDIFQQLSVIQSPVTGEDVFFASAEHSRETILFQRK